MEVIYDEDYYPCEPCASCENYMQRIYGSNQDMAKYFMVMAETCLTAIEDELQ